MHPLLIALALAAPACWSSSPVVQPVAPGNPASIAPEDATLDRDLDRLAAYLAHTGEPFTAVELVGFTATHGIVYRTTVCDPDELGGRGPYCMAEVCIDPPGADAGCEALVDETVDEPSGTFDLNRARVAIRSAEAARHPMTRGHTEAPSVVTVAARGGDLSLRAPAWFGPTSWTVLQAYTHPDTNERFGLTTAAISSVLSSDDGTCLAVAGTAFRLARYESVVGSVRTAFAARHCRGATRARRL